LTQWFAGQSCSTDPQIQKGSNDECEPSLETSRGGAARLGRRVHAPRGFGQVLGLFPPEQVAKLGLGVPIQVIGAGELVMPSLLVPRTASLGDLLTSGFWAAPSACHVQGESFVSSPSSSS